MKVQEIYSKSILSPSKVYDYVINPYVGCQHACSYCYARFMKRFTGHREPWGDFVDVKINAPDLLNKEIRKKKKGTVWISGVCDPYQPLEAKYGLTRKCLDILVQNDWPAVVQTRSPLVLRDMDIFKKSKGIEVGLSITTADDEIRKVFEPDAPSIMERLRAVETLHQNGIRTYAMIAPMLPEAENLTSMLAGKVDYIIIDRMNYRHADRIYEKHGWKEKNTDAYFKMIGNRIANDFMRWGIECRPAY
ncbi:MAG: radical SAM protein [Desulfobacterales bacterium]|nr:radical SAM protein [Desulfobacterales bacterium]MDD3949587.1 radical SAM protein [Desulfobacterales bacterium]